MRKKGIWIAAALMITAAMLLSCDRPSSQEAVKAKEPAESSSYTLTVLTPQGHVKKEKLLAPRLDNLEGKKIAMWLSATPDQLYAGKGAELYDILEKKLKDNYPNVQIVHYADLPMKYNPQNEVVDAIISSQPDAVVAGFGG
jgi:ABC-type amino acid transport substrate-binding protein